ncbi:MAG: pentapeptide repeat-containing protein [Hormoscilla sp.]
MPNLQSTISKYPDFGSHGYEIIRELGRNWSGGHITYHAKNIDSDREVVIKEFRFALSDASWSSFKAYEREIQVLQQLDHPRIPPYLNSFETRSGFCLVTEYKDAPTLESRRNFTPAQVKQIALSVLEILVYLQQKKVIHRDIKPENILLDDRLNAYLVDFGLARLRDGEVAASSVAAGTPGFMPPEEMFDRALTTASDLYSLGATLICLLTGTRSVDITDLINDNLCFNLKDKPGQLSRSFIDWLTKMTSPQVKQRYANAEIALSALKPIKVVGDIPVPEKSEIKPRKLTPVLLTTLSFIALLGTSWGIYWYNLPINQLLRTRECQDCDLQNAQLVDANLKSANLSGANLSGAKFQGAYLANANLESANLESANLSGAYLQDANLSNGNLSGANLEGVKLDNAALQGVNFQDANLQKVKLQGVNLQGANLQGVNLKNADLKTANLGGTNLKNANLENANLRTNLWDANLSGANLKGANLSDAYLEDANLAGANLSDANLQGAKLKGANLQGANLQGANLQGVNMRGVKIDEATQLDENLRLVWQIVNQGAEGVNLGNVNLSDADLSHANMAGSNLEGANLKGANLQNAKLQYANLEGANLQAVKLKGANLQYANLKDAQLLGANFWEANLSGAIMPDGTIRY